ncbi:integrase core domain-containing protein [uncultured Tateyamaria sp.]|uniref:integrase core domain-containing protein n=1 Tax=uncultured Tateyamaria sp. TaxID=455651 RepID=UPI002632A462|nr:integrase core domain-containing protein [uncultured Tateyamaria sp.]
MRPTHPNHVWAINFVHDKLGNGRSYKLLTVLDEYTREALCVMVRLKMNASDVLDVMHRLLMKHGKPEFIRSDNGPEFIAPQPQDWLRRVDIQPMQIYPGSPWGNEYNERFNGTLRREVLNADWFHSTKQAQIAINIWLRQYNQIRPHHALGMHPPAPKILLDKPQISGTGIGG